MLLSLVGMRLRCKYLKTIRVGASSFLVPTSSIAQRKAFLGEPFGMNGFPKLSIGLFHHLGMMNEWMNERLGLLGSWWKSWGSE